jgi:hypothetical protein
MTDIDEVEKEIEITSKQEPNSRPINVIFYKDGALSFSTDFAETFVYLYKDEVDVLKASLCVDSTGDKKCPQE